MDNIAIERENVTKFLGVLIDEKPLRETTQKQCQHKNIQKHWYTTNLEE